MAVEHRYQLAVLIEDNQKKRTAQTVRFGVSEQKSGRWKTS